MISRNFYNKSNLISQFLGGKVKHYPIKDASITISWSIYQFKTGETIYTLASKIFGHDLEYLWTYIADNNPPRHPDEWSVGDHIRIPKLIIRDSDTQITLYSNATSPTT